MTNSNVLTERFPCEKKDGYPIASQVFTWSGDEIRLDKSDPPRCLRSISGYGSMGDCAYQKWVYEEGSNFIRYGAGGLCLNPVGVNGRRTVRLSECQLCPPVMNWTITEV